MNGMIWISRIGATLIAGVAVFFVFYRVIAVVMNWYKSISDKQKREAEAASEALNKIFVNIKPGQFLKIRVGIVTGSFLLVFLITMTWWLALPIAVFAYFTPPMFVKYMINKRRKTIEHQLVDGLSLVSNALRAGFSIVQAFDVMVKEMPAPIADEFSQVLHENKLGISLEEGLENLSKRVNSNEIELLVTSIVIARQTGGNLAEILNRIVATLRERAKIHGQIKSLTAQGKLSGYVVGALPFLMAFIINVVDPQMMKPMYSTGLGWLFLVAVVVLESLGFFFILKIVAIDV